MAVVAVIMAALPIVTTVVRGKGNWQAGGFQPEGGQGVLQTDAEISRPDGSMTGVRSSRKLEAACRDQISYLWLTGWQHPDHNTLWRFYQAHRQAMRKLLKYTVATAV